MVNATIYCCQCKKDVEARLTDGAEVYGHRADLAALPFWKCDACGNYVGCHHQTGTPTKPLGNIPFPELRNARQHIHKLIDPLWKSKEFHRNRLYAHLRRELGYDYHTAEIKTVEEARTVYATAVRVINNLRRVEAIALPADHPYLQLFHAEFHPFRDKWRVTWRSFDSQPQDEILDTKEEAQKLAQKLRRKARYLTEQERGEYDVHNKFWQEMAENPKTSTPKKGKKHASK